MLAAPTHRGLQKLREKTAHRGLQKTARNAQWGSKRQRVSVRLEIPCILQCQPIVGWMVMMITFPLVPYWTPNLKVWVHGTQRCYNKQLGLHLVQLSLCILVHSGKVKAQGSGISKVGPLFEIKVCRDVVELLWQGILSHTDLVDLILGELWGYPSVEGRVHGAQISHLIHSIDKLLFAHPLEHCVHEAKVDPSGGVDLIFILNSTREAAMGRGGLGWVGWMADWQVAALAQNRVGMGWDGLGWNGMGQEVQEGENTC